MFFVIVNWKCDGLWVYMLLSCYSSCFLWIWLKNEIIFPSHFINWEIFMKPLSLVTFWKDFNYCWITFLPSTVWYSVRILCHVGNYLIDCKWLVRKLSNNYMFKYFHTVICKCECHQAVCHQLFKYTLHLSIMIMCGVTLYAIQFI